ncbi:MAG: PDZ domain-containing protein [Alphaproteobacteria bacterium]
MFSLARRCRFVVAVTCALSTAPLARHAAAMPGDAILPAPSISRALDAVLLPIDDDVIDAFGLAPDDYGVLVLAVQPGGVADWFGIEPGDILYEVAGTRIRNPRHLDALILHYLWLGVEDYAFNFYRAGQIYSVETLITIEYYEEVVSFEEVWTWESWSYSEFSYTEYMESYVSEVETAYYEEAALIEEEALDESVVESEVSEDAVYDDTGAADEALDEATPFADDAGADDGQDAAAYEDGDADAVLDPCADGSVDEGCFEDEAMVDEQPFEDDASSEDDAFVDEGGSEAEVYDDGDDDFGAVDESGGDEVLE